MYVIIVNADKVRSRSDKIQMKLDLSKPIVVVSQMSYVFLDSEAHPLLTPTQLHKIIWRHLCELRLQ